MRFRHVLGLGVLAGLLTASIFAESPTAASVQPHDRIAGPVSDNRTVVLSGNVHPLVAVSSSQTASADMPMQRMILSLKADSSQNGMLEQLIAQQHDPKSLSYHQFLTPQDFGSHFGVSQADMDKVVAWLTAHGFTIDEIPASRRSIVFSGTSGQVAATFNTQIRQYNAAGSTHFANAGDPQVPAALSDVVGGIVKLHDFRHQHSLVKPNALPQANVLAPQFNSGSSHYLSPADYSAIYNMKSLYSAGIDGTGQTIAVIARSNIAKSDVSTFRQAFGLPVNDPTMVIVNRDPGLVSGDSTETILDTEWAGAVAPKAAVKVVIAASTNTADGIDLASQYAVNNNVASVITLSYGSCEAYMGSSELGFYHSLWQQAAAQGITVLVSSGDSGAAGCNGGSSSTGSVRGVNGLCSSPYATCVGGTQFNDTSNPGQYWYPGNNSVYGSAIGYIPESVWNESGSNGGSGLWAGGGGASSFFAKPSWQSGTGVPADGRRDVPDVSLTAAGHDGYVIVQSGSMYSVGGTSASAPSFAGLMALVNQKTGTRQGNANTTLYPLATMQTSGGAAIFHDIISGTNSVPGVAGFAATTGYDLATGLGSVDATQLVNHWTDASTPVAPSITLAGSSTNLTLKAGATVQTTITSTTSSSLKTAVALSVSGIPAGLTATLGANSVASPGSGSVALTVTAASSLKPGTYAFSVNAQGGGQTATLAIAVVVPAPSFTLTANSSLTAYAGEAASLPIAVTPSNGFSAVVSLSVSGLPSGVTAAFSAPVVNAANTATTNLNLTLSKTVSAGSYLLTLTATGGGITQTLKVTLVVSVRASCTLTANPGALTLPVGQSAGVQVVCGSVQGTFSGPIGLTVAGQPSGMSAALSSATVAAGSAVALNVTASTATKAGGYSLLITASTTGFSQTLSLPVSVTVPSTFTLSSGAATLSLKPGGSGQIGFSTAHAGAFNSAINLTVSGTPTGVTATLSRTAIAAPGDGTGAVIFAVSTSARPGVYPVTITATGGGVTQTMNASLTVAANADFSFAVSTNSMTLQQGGAFSPVTISTGNFTGGFNSTITITFTNLAPGMNWKFISGSAANNLVNNTIGFWVPTYTTPGVYPMTVTASGAGITHSAIVNVTVVKAGTQVTSR